MKTHWTLILVAICTLLMISVELGVVPVQAAPVRTSSGDGEPTPTPLRGTPTTITRTTPAYQFPNMAAPKVGQLLAGAPVVVNARVGEWFQIADKTTPGWVPGDVLAAPLPSVPSDGPSSSSLPNTTPSVTPSNTPRAAPSDAPSNVPSSVPSGGGGSAPASPAPEHIGVLPGAAPVPTSANIGTNAPVSTSVNRGTDAPIPGSAGGTVPVSSSTGQVVPVAKPIIIEQCIDPNANRGCDVNEGIAGVTDYVLDKRTGQVLGQSVSNERGIAQVYITTTSDAQLVVNVPFLNERLERPATSNEQVSIVVGDTATNPGSTTSNPGIPGLLP